MHSFILNQFKDEEVYLKIITITKISVPPERFDNHSDIHIIKPEQSKGSLTKSASIKIDTIRKIQSLLINDPLNLPTRIVIIHQADLLTPAAQNAFLKILEEPRVKTTFFLCTTNYQTLLPTIISRCQLINFKNSNNNQNQLDQNIIEEFKTLAKSTPIQRMAKLENRSKDKNETIDWLKSCLTVLGQNSLDLTLDKLGSLQTNFLTAFQDIQNNVSPKLALDNLAINWDNKPHKLDY
jgi:replication-associated recombination protein RarA